TRCRRCAPSLRANCNRSKPSHSATPSHSDCVAMTQSMRVRLLLGSALLIVPLQAHSQDQIPAQAPLPLAPRKPVTVAAVQPAAAVRRATTPHQPVTVGAVRPAATAKRPKLV